MVKDTSVDNKHPKDDYKGYSLSMRYAGNF
jgi:hypothetical protein